MLTTKTLKRPRKPSLSALHLQCRDLLQKYIEKKNDNNNNNNDNNNNNNNNNNSNSNNNNNNNNNNKVEADYTCRYRNSDYYFIIHCFVENIQKLLCEMQYKGKLTKRRITRNHSITQITRNHSGAHLAAKILLASENSALFIMSKLCTALKCQLSANLNVFRLPNE